MFGICQLIEGEISGNIKVRKTLKGAINLALAIINEDAQEILPSLDNVRQELKANGCYKYGGQDECSVSIKRLDLPEPTNTNLPEIISLGKDWHAGLNLKLLRGIEEIFTMKLNNEGTRWVVMLDYKTTDDGRRRSSTYEFKTQAEADKCKTKTLRRLRRLGIVAKSR